ncbi:hypothetical protein C7S16_6249 [Burkholderia thailandensis]|uniref:Uncharacterized protein n=1 Tax=Burkholderia thailandensis TaxID=57975 RepID=A0AAW9CLX3_BURTH|nr:hypothetical protein [Burkholderia thailandensis]MDW9251640.1 hypothetical protein [Burkholderia thailandensis]
MLSITRRAASAAIAFRAAAVSRVYTCARAHAHSILPARQNSCRR